MEEGGKVGEGERERERKRRKGRKGVRDTSLLSIKRVIVCN